MEETEESIHTFYISPARGSIIVSDFINFDDFMKHYNKIKDDYQRPKGIYKTIRGRNIAIRKYTRDGSE